MTNDPDDAEAFAGRLIAAEPVDPALRARSEAALLALRERRLSPIQRALGWLALPLTAWLGLGTAYRLIAPGRPEPREWAILQAVAAVALLTMGGWTAWVLVRRGGRVAWADDRAMEWLGGIGLVALVLALFEVARALDDPRAGLRLAGVATVLLVGGAWASLVRRQRRQALETRAALLALELKLAARSRTGP
jgi:hypothetical protein